MKVFALILLCAFAAVQGRSAVVKNTRAVAALGENPWVVHLRIAVSTSGLLETCGGSLIDNRWVLTTANCLTNVRFIWVRYGAVNVINPSLVTENSAVRLHPGYVASTGENNIGLISINRFVHSTDNIAPVSLDTSAVLPESASYCGFGEDTGVPGEVLSCYDVTLEAKDGGLLAGSSDDLEASQFDIGASLVSEGVQIAVLVGTEDGAGSFLPVVSYLEWIEGETGLALTPEVATTEAAETTTVAAEEEDDAEEESRSVKFVN